MRKPDEQANGGILPITDDQNDLLFALSSKELAQLWQRTGIASRPRRRLGAGHYRETKRKQLVRNIASECLQKDPQAARAWLASLSLP